MGHLLTARLGAGASLQRPREIDGARERGGPACATNRAMRRFRVGLLDVCAAVLVLIVLVMPGRDLHVGTGYRHVEAAALPTVLADVAQAQADVLVAPGDGGAAERLAQILGTRPVDQHDQALRVAGEAAGRAGSPTRWRALLAASSAHADRIELKPAHRLALEALAACEAPDAACPAHEVVRLRLYAEQLDVGVQAMAAGADPRVEPERFRREMGRIHPTTTYRVRGDAP